MPKGVTVSWGDPRVKHKKKLKSESGGKSRRKARRSDLLDDYYNQREVGWQGQGGKKEEAGSHGKDLEFRGRVFDPETTTFDGTSEIKVIF